METQCVQKSLPEDPPYVAAVKRAASSLSSLSHEGAGTKGAPPAGVGHVASMYRKMSLLSTWTCHV
jgi:hypothetical protein